MKIDFEGRVWQLEMDEVTVKQGEKIQAYTGLTPSGWYKTITGTDEPGWLKSMQCLYWLLRAQNGEPDVPISELDFAPLKLLAAFGTAAGEDAAAAAKEQETAEADPTRPADGSGATGQTP